MFTQDIRDFSALLFDLDGVITPTADLHQQAWRTMFENFLAHYSTHQGVSIAPYTDQDYFDFLDGRRRDEGIPALLSSRGIELSEEEVLALGEQKNEDFLSLLAQGMNAYPGSVELLDWIANHNVSAKQPLRIAVVSSSKNALPVLQAAGLAERFELIVDGIVASEKGLPGKPAGDTYVYAAQQLGIPVDQCVVVEDATSGVAAGKDGHFGLVVGVDRGAGAEALQAAGADEVLQDLHELIPRS